MARGAFKSAMFWRALVLYVRFERQQKGVEGILRAWND